MVKDLVNLNKITENTWRWLRVNSCELKNITIHEKSSYVNSNLFNDVTKKYIIDDKNIIENITSKFSNYENNNGISDELNELNLNNCNSEYIINIPENEKVSKHLFFDYKLDLLNNSLFDNITIVSGKYSEATVVINYDSISDEDMFHNGIIKIYADDNSKLNLVIIQTLNDTSINFDSIVTFAGYKSEINTSVIDIGAYTSIKSYTSYLVGENSSATLKNVYFGSNNNFLDMNYVMNHIGKKSNSSIIVKGALKDGAKKIFRGTIDFKTGATRSTGEESENVILLSDNIKNDSVPLLLCGEDDVSGAHAASVGKINEAKLFYLMSRGFSKKEANKIIIEGEFSSIINIVPDEKILEKVMDIIKRRLENE